MALPHPPGTGLDPGIAHRAAAAAIGSLLGRIAAAFADSAAQGDTGRAAAMPGTLALTSG